MPPSLTQAPGLVLDDYLNWVTNTRRDFELSEPTLNLKQLASQVGATGAINKIINDTIKRHGSEIFSTQHSLLANFGDQIYADEISEPGFATRNRMSTDRVPQVLGRVLEVGLQTVVQLPARFPTPAYAPRQLKALASRLSGLAQKASMAFSKDEFRVRCNVHFRGEPKERERIDRLPDELLYAAATLNALAKLKKIKSLPLASRNPQVRVALYMAGWLNASTGEKQYESLSTLIAAAFYASGEHSPPWADRLPIEMHRHRQHRRQWIASISK